MVATKAKMSPDPVDSRCAIRRNAPSVFARDNHVWSCRVLPDRIALLRELPRHGAVAEVGVSFADLTKNILTHNLLAKLHLIDKWSSDRYARGLEAIKEAHRSLIAEGKLHIHKGTSLAMLESFPDGYFDWIYIDTNHTYSTTAAELRLGARKLKRGGFIAGHDYLSPATSLRPGLMESSVPAMSFV
jgi:hypothetical protein